jgi:DNA-binding NarL/FixJ family response regulator
MIEIILYTQDETLKFRILELLPNILVKSKVDSVEEKHVIITDAVYAGKLLKSRTLNLLVLSDTPTLAEGLPLLQLGAKGYTNTYIHLLHLNQAIEAIGSGNVWISPSFMQDLISRVEPDEFRSHPNIDSLTNRENEVAQLIKSGLSNKEIASKLNITERTVKQHLSHIFEKLDVHDRLSLATVL